MTKHFINYYEKICWHVLVQSHHKTAYGVCQTIYVKSLFVYYI